MSVIYDKPMFAAADAILAGSLNPQPNNLFTLSAHDGTVISVQPDGTFETRPAGTAGPWELCGQNGNTLTYCPDGVHIYTFPFFTAVPNV